MNRLTQNERAALDEIFAAIYAGRQSKFSHLYNILRKKIATKADKFRTKFQAKFNHFKALNLKRK